MAKIKEAPMSSLCPVTGDQLLPEHRYFSEGDVISRLSGTYIRYKNRAIFVNQSLNRMLDFFYCNDSSSDKILEQVHSDSIHLDISSPPLGYLNGTTQCFYTRRVPRRRWKQGIDSGAVYITSHENEGHEDSHFSNFSAKVIGKMIEGEYPSVQQIIKELTAGQKLSAAFHRQFALGNYNYKKGTAILFYKAEVAGFVEIKNDVPVVKMLPTFFHSAYMEILANTGFVVQQ